jgi:hypothetical protein
MASREETSADSVFLDDEGDPGRVGTFHHVITAVVQTPMTASRSM